MGVKSITLRPGDSIVSALLIKDEEGSILTVTEKWIWKKNKNRWISITGKDQVRE